MTSLLTSEGPIGQSLTAPEATHDAALIPYCIVSEAALSLIFVEEDAQDATMLSLAENVASDWLVPTLQHTMP